MRSDDDDYDTGLNIRNVLIEDLREKYELGETFKPICNPYGNN
ncbi:MAG TPA: hypothetical protein VIK84_04080 [Haloplasmataceae bacterium]